MAQITTKMAFLDKAKKSTGSHGAISANKVSVQEGAKEEMIMAFRADISKIICFNCGELGHGSRFCKKTKAVCGVCSRNHLYKMHKIVMDQEAKLKAKASSYVRMTANALHKITDDMLNEDNGAASYSHHSAINPNLKSAGDENIDTYLTSRETSQQEGFYTDDDTLIKDILEMYATSEEEAPIHALFAIIEHDVNAIKDDSVLMADVIVKESTPQQPISTYLSKHTMQMKWCHRVLMNRKINHGKCPSVLKRTYPTMHLVRTLINMGCSNYVL